MRPQIREPATLESKEAAALFQALADAGLGPRNLGGHRVANADHSFHLVELTDDTAVGRHRLALYECDSAWQALSLATHIKPRGDGMQFDFDDGTKEGLHIESGSLHEARWYLRGRIVVEYQGSDLRVVRALRAVCGTAIAGPD